MSVTERLPPSDTPTLRQLAEPFAELKRKLGVTGEQWSELEAEPRSSGEPYARHAEFEGQRYADPTLCEGTLRIEDQSGTLWTVVCDVCGFEVGVEMRHSDPERLVEHRLGKAGLPEEFAGKEFAKGDLQQQPTLRACREWLRRFRPAALEDSIPAIALYGRAGRGKTHLLSLIVETLVRSHAVDAVYRSAGELFDELRAGIDTGAYEVRWQRILRVAVLALDDLGAGRWTEWTQDRFAMLVDYRYSKGLPLLVATNIPPAGWDKKFGDRTASRLRGMCLRFELEGPDRRDAAQQSLLDRSAGGSKPESAS